jgi:hypothetical protein
MIYAFLVRNWASVFVAPHDRIHDAQRDHAIVTSDQIPHRRRDQIRVAEVDLRTCPAQNESRTGNRS